MGIILLYSKSLIDNNDLAKTETISFNSIFTVINTIVSDSVITKRGKHIYAAINFSGSLTSSSSGKCNILSINTNYRPIRDFSAAVMINSDVNNGEIYTSAVIYSTENKSKLAVMFPKINTTYGNSSYPWCTSGWLRIDWEIG